MDKDNNPYPNKNLKQSNNRRQKVYLSPITINYLHLRNPYLVAWLSALFPGLGYLFLGKNIKGFILIIWEIIINVKAHINSAIIYSFIGSFETAKELLDKRWLLLYAATYTFIIWDGYRTTIELNKQTILAERENVRYKPFNLKSLELNFLDKKNPWVSVVWSGFMPGLGHLYVHRLPTGIFIFVWWITITYFSHLAEAFHFTAIGSFHQARAIVDFEWLLFMPSIHTFAVYDSYVQTVENNKLFELEQSNYLKDNYQSKEFRMPI